MTERNVDWKRFIRHLVTDHWSARRAFPARVLSAIEREIGEQERRHGGEVRFAVEASLPLGAVFSGTSASARALEHFGRLGVWDTEENNGVLIYLLLADRRVEIVADRGIHSRVGAAAWETICGEMQREFGLGNFEQGVKVGVRAISDLLAAHYPPGGRDGNELPDRPVVI